MMLIPKNWAEFQHYKGRSPPWIKLHRNLLDNYDFACLPLASRALAPCLWLIASEYDRGEITASLEELAFRLRITVSDLTAGLKPLIEKGFIIECKHDASTMLAACKQDAIPEERERREETEIEAESEREAQPRARRAPARTRLPDEFEPDRNYAKAMNFPEVQITRMVAAFRNHHTAKGNLMASWPAAWRTWCGNEIKFGGGGKNGNAKSQLQSTRDRLWDSIRRDLAGSQAGGRPAPGPLQIVKRSEPGGSL